MKEKTISQANFELKSLDMGEKTISLENFEI